MIQTSAVIDIGTNNAPSPPARTPSDWAVIIPEVLATSKWALIHFFIFDSGAPAITMNSINLELGVGPPGQEVRAWRTISGLCGGSELEFDDSGWTKYVPFNFQKGVAISGRFARIGSVAQLQQIQLQLHS